jgi:hypothetical protein
MGWDYDDEEINGLIDANIKDSPPNPPAVNSASVLRTFLKAFWVAIRTQVAQLMDIVEQSNSITVDTYAQAVPYFTGQVARNIYVTADTVNNEGKPSIYTFHPTLGVALDNDFDFANGTAKNIALGALAVAFSQQEGTDFTLPIGELNSKVTAIHTQVDSYWRGKNILWIGTSIPATGYPEIACGKIGANCNNQALGSSMMRVSHRNGTIDGIPFSSFYRSLMKTIAESNWLIANWNNSTGTAVGSSPTAWTTFLVTTYINNNLSIRSQLTGAPVDINTIESGSLTYADVMRGASFENRVLPYLPGTRVNSLGQTVGNGYINGVGLGVDGVAGPICDLIVIDHGYNDYNSAAITGVATDSPTDFTTVPGTRDNYYYFLGAANKLIDLCTKANPKIRIAFSGHYENLTQPNVATAQQTLASLWLFPILKLWEKTGWSQQTVPVSGVTIKNSWLSTDGLHPVEADSKGLIANYCSQFLTNIY